MTDGSFHLNPNSIPYVKSFGIASVRPVSAIPGTNVVVSRQLPSFVRENHPRFVSFLEAYYSWLEANRNVNNLTRRMKYLQDVDFTATDLFDKFHDEFLVNLPKNLSVNRRTLLKYIRQFYRSKGTEKSFRFFFRILYDTTVEFYYPRVDILKTSDGKWIQNTTLRLIPITGTLKDFYNTTLYASNGAEAFVDSVNLVNEKHIFAVECVLNQSSISGHLRAGDIITTASGHTARISAVPTTSEVYVNPLNRKDVRAGTGYKKGDTFRIPDVDGTWKGALLVVRSVGVEDGEIKRVEFTRFGLEYTKDAKYSVVLNSSLAEDGTDRSSEEIDATFVVSTGGTFKYPGYYLNNDGHLSSNKFIHDGEFYQQFSYVLYTDRNTSEYEALLKKSLHPVGLKFIGSMRTQTVVSAKPSLPQSQSSLHIITQSHTQAAPDVAESFALMTHETVENPNSVPVGASLRSIYRERFRYKPFEGMSDSMNEGNSGYWEVPHANTSIETIDSLGFTPHQIDTAHPNKRINIQPDSEIVSRSTTDDD